MICGWEAGHPEALDTESRALMFSRKSAAIRTLALVLTACAASPLGFSPARAEALLLVDVASGKVLFAQNATQPKKITPSSHSVKRREARAESGGSTQIAQ